MFIFFLVYAQSGASYHHLHAICDAVGGSVGGKIIVAAPISWELLHKLKIWLASMHCYPYKWTVFIGRSDLNRIIQNSHWLFKTAWHDVYVPTACIKCDYWADAKKW